LATLLFGGVIYWLLGKRIANSKTDVETQIKNTKKSLEEESVKLDSKLVEMLDTQLKLKQEEKQMVSANSTIEIDHSLALKVADEIVRIHKNLQQMDANTKGLKQLSASVKRIQDNFASNGYELVEMLGKEYNEGMKAAPNFVPSEDVEKGKQIITRIIKPQVNFKNEMIQSAQIEVSVGE
jgi:predicted RNase H-like nuclease (RuvC/YqgF family)